MTPIEFKSRLERAVALDFGTIFTQSVELFKKSWLHGLLMQLISMIVILPLMLILYLPFITMLISNAGSDSFEPDEMSGLLAGYTAFYIVLLFIGLALIAGIQIAINAGFVRMLKQLDHDRPVKTADLFYFFKTKYLGKIILLMLISILIAIPAALLFYLPLIYVCVPLAFITIVFSFNPEWSVGDIVGSSFGLGNKKWLLTFGLLIVAYILMFIASMVTCGLGTLFVAPFLTHPLYYIYKGTVGFDDYNELDEIGKPSY